MSTSPNLNIIEMNNISDYNVHVNSEIMSISVNLKFRDKPIQIFYRNVNLLNTDEVMSKFVNMIFMYKNHIIITDSKKFLFVNPEEPTRQHSNYMNDFERLIDSFA